MSADPRYPDDLLHVPLTSRDFEAAVAGRPWRTMCDQRRGPVRSKRLQSAAAWQQDPDGCKVCFDDDAASDGVA